MWRFEEREFTPWLLENADALGDALNTDVELSEREIASARSNSI